MPTDFTMSLIAGKAKPPNYETLLNNTPTSLPTLNVSLATDRNDVNHSAPTYQGLYNRQTWNVRTVRVAATVSPNVDSSAPFFQEFLKGKPKASGILVIVAAIIEIPLGIAVGFTTISSSVPSGIPFWGPIFYIIAGSVTIEAQKRPNIRLVKASLYLNIFSTFLATVALILNVLDFVVMITDDSYNYPNDYYSNHNDFNTVYEAPNNHQSHHNGEAWEGHYPFNGALTLLSLLLMTNVLLFSVTLSTSIFGCRSLYKAQAQAHQVILIQHHAVFPVNPGAAPGSFVQRPPPPPLLQ
ncbi:membrane-spanning 4-domains subfamily A member 4A-like isoform X4 [Hyperolius riggenbachi]|uniref:membrane-spanning 4-domains subfamily A member 4A-like isoform X4 n=1 Tax=Hyperolius riggenbachi TaxID=752182 RepID=UPI0035A3794B